jgi:cysteine-rich repeat protein
MIHASNWRRGSADARTRALRPALLSLALAFFVGCSGSRDENLNTLGVGRSDASVVTDEEAEDAEPIDDEMTDGSEADAEAVGAADEASVEQPIDAGDFDAIVSVDVADASAAPDTTVVVEIPLCGNGTVDPDEECDQGASNSDTVPGACRSNCRSARCGDGVVDQGEACDRGASNSDSEANACRVNCTEARCGDGVVDQNEQCDTGEARSDTAAGACRLACGNPRCGDGVRDTDEGCDDGNSVDTDSCRNTCRGARCGDGVTDPDEECDDGNTVNTDSCRNACRSPICGDGVVDAPSEQCDDGNRVSNDGCRANCQTGCRTDAACANGVFCDGAERCSDGLCVAGTAPALGDGIACTDDSCNEALDRVVHTPNNARCTAPDGTCSGGRGTTNTATCSASSGCVISEASASCDDTASRCEGRGDGSAVLFTYAPACEDGMSCGDPNESMRVCPAIAASCTNRVYRPRAAATCNANTESCGNATPTTQDCRAADQTSCASDSSTFTEVRGTCSAAGCGVAPPVVTTCPDPADSCVNAHRRAFAPTCTNPAGCGTERVVVDEDCTARATTCGAAANGAPAVQRYTAACDSSNPGQCVSGGRAEAPESCTAPGRVCSTPVGGGPSVTNYVAACRGAACVAGGVAEGSPTPCSAAASTCGPNPDGPRGALRQTNYTAACETGSSCYPSGRQDFVDCRAGAATCELDGQRRAVRTSYTASCNTANTACLTNGAASVTYCDQEPTTCNASGQPVDTVNECNGAGCTQVTGRACPTNVQWVCSSRTLRRQQQGRCMFGPGCMYADTGVTETCPAPQCVNLGATAVSCGGCGVDANGAVSCNAACVACPNGCSGGVCRTVTGIAGGVISPAGGIVSPGDVIIPGGGVLSP